MADMELEIDALDRAIKSYVLDNEDYEDADYKLTRVQGHRRTWNVEKLERILPRGIFKNVTTTVADPAKLDQYVREGKIKLAQLKVAYDETPSAPYVKVTKKSHNAERGEAEADSLAEALG